MSSQPPGISSKASTRAISSPPASDKVQAAPTSSGNLSAQASTAKLAALSTSASATAGEDPQNMSLIRRLSISADETTSKMSRKLSSMADEGRQALRRNNTVVSMASTGVHVITDAGIHLPHELHVPNIGLSHPANATLGAVTAAVVAGSLVSPMITVLDLAIVRSQFDHIGVGTAVKRTASDLYTGRASWNPALRIMGGVYLSTYMAANGTEAWCTVSGVKGGRGSGRRQGGGGGTVGGGTGPSRRSLLPLFHCHDAFLFFSFLHLSRSGKRHRLQDSYCRDYLPRQHCGRFPQGQGLRTHDEEKCFLLPSLLLSPLWHS